MKKVLAGLLLAAMAALYGCSGEGASGPATAVGKFVDAPVAGLQYESGSQKGVTSADGSFTYEVGKKVKFTVGDIVLGEAPAQAVMTPIDLSTTANADSTTPDVVARVQLLMSLSSTDPTTANGVITIPPAALTAAKGKTINFTAPTNLSEVVGQLVTGKTLVTETDAKAHFAASLEKLKTPTTPTTTGFTTAIVSGKVLQDATTWDNVAAVNTRVFNADGSYKLTTAYVSSPNTLLTTNTGTWSINSSGQLVVTTTTSTGGDPLGTRTFDLVSATSTGLTVSSNGTTGVFTYVTTPATSGFTTAMISGKSIVMNPANPAHVYTYNSDGTWTAKYTDGSTTATSSGTWSIDTNGRLLFKKLYDPLDSGASSTVGVLQTMTLVSSTSTTLTVSSNGTTGVFTYVTTPATNGFTTAMISGKTFAISSSSGNTATTTFNANGTYSGTQNGASKSGIWSINGSGQLIVTETGSSPAVMTLVTSGSTTYIVSSLQGNVTNTITITAI